MPAVIPNPIDPCGMADLDLAQAPRGLADTVSAWIKRGLYRLYSVGMRPTEQRVRSAPALSV